MGPRAADPARRSLAGGAGFAAFGGAIGGAAREVRASSLLAFMISLPIAFLSLVPERHGRGGVYDLIQVVRALFPFHPALDALEGALDAAGPDVAIAAAPPGRARPRLRRARPAGLRRFA